MGRGGAGGEGSEGGARGERRRVGVARDAPTGYPPALVPSGGPASPVGAQEGGGRKRAPSHQPWSLNRCQVFASFSYKLGVCVVGGATL